MEWHIYCTVAYRVRVIWWWNFIFVLVDIKKLEPDCAAHYCQNRVMDFDTTVEPSNLFTNGHIFVHSNNMWVIFFDTHIYLIHESQPTPLDLLKYVLINNMHPHWPAKKTTTKNDILHHRHLADKWDRGSDWEQPALCSQAVTLSPTLRRWRIQSQK